MIICILGVCGTFMANIACLARELGHEVIGYDSNAYPPMSDLLQATGIEILPMPETPSVPETADLILVGNSIRGDGPWPAFLSNNPVPYLSAPEWLRREILINKKVIAIAGTHGKTTTTTMVATILRKVGWDPGYLIGGVSPGFNYPAHVGTSEYFVIESDEYSTAYFDTGPKFMHYKPWVFLLNNLEFDHADLYKDLNAIEVAFERGIALLPEDGVLIYGQDYPSAAQLGENAAVHNKVSFGSKGEWSIGQVSEDGQQFELCQKGKVVARISWGLCGQHNRLNGLAAVAIANELGINPEASAKALSSFEGVKRRLEYLGEFSGVHFYDDFAHHPTSIDKTLRGVRAKVGEQRVVALLHLASNTMRSGLHGSESLAKGLVHADEVVLLADGATQWDVESMRDLVPNMQVASSVQEAVEKLKECLRLGDHLVFMGNRSLQELQNNLKEGLSLL